MNQLARRAPGKPLKVSWTMKFIRRFFNILFLIAWAAFIKLPLSLLALFISSVVEVLELCLGITMRKNLIIDEKWPKLKSYWQDTKQSLKDIFTIYSIR